MAVTQAPEDETIRSEERPEAETATAFDAAVAEFLPYPPSRKASAYAQGYGGQVSGATATLP
jgi:hypothetical protein